MSLQSKQKFIPFYCLTDSPQQSLIMGSKMNI